MTEQLRTIHLTLLLICLVLLATTFAERNGPLKRAYEESMMIERWTLQETEVTKVLLDRTEKLFSKDKHLTTHPYLCFSSMGAPLFSVKGRFWYGTVRICQRGRS